MINREGNLLYCFARSFRSLPLRLTNQGLVKLPFGKFLMSLFLSPIAIDRGHTAWPRTNAFSLPAPSPHPRIPHTRRMSPRGPFQGLIRASSFLAPRESRSTFSGFSWMRHDPLRPNIKWASQIIRKGFTKSWTVTFIWAPMSPPAVIEGRFALVIR